MRLADRFWAKVKKGERCWVWMAYRVPLGYGRFRVGGARGEMTPAHRVAYELVKGPIPQGREIDHLCRNPSCVNPEHLEAVTKRVNQLRGKGFVASNASKTHCKYGHIFDEKNTYHDPKGRRQCRACKASWQREYLQRRTCH